MHFLTLFSTTLALTTGLTLATPLPSPSPATLFNLTATAIHGTSDLEAVLVRRFPPEQHVVGEYPDGTKMCKIWNPHAQWTQPCKPELTPEQYLRLLRIEVCQHGDVCCLPDGSPCGDYWKPSSGGFEDEKLDQPPRAGPAGEKASE